MSNAYDCAIAELGLDYSLQYDISLCVDRCCCFIKYQDAATFQKHTTQAEELSLAHTPVVPILCHCLTTPTHHSCQDQNKENDAPKAAVCVTTTEPEINIV
jgi:hypothetical protein